MVLFKEQKLSCIADICWIYLKIQCHCLHHPPFIKCTGSTTISDDFISEVFSSVLQYAFSTDCIAGSAGKLDSSNINNPFGYNDVTKSKLCSFDKMVKTMVPDLWKYLSYL